MNGPVLVNSENLNTTTETVVINTSVVPDFSDVSETPKEQDVVNVQNTANELKQSTSNNVASLLTDLQADFLSVVKLVDALNKTVALYGDKVKHIEQTLTKGVDASSNNHVILDPVVQSTQVLPTSQPLPHTQPTRVSPAAQTSRVYPQRVVPTSQTQQTKPAELVQQLKPVQKKNRKRRF